MRYAMDRESHPDHVFTPHVLKWRPRTPLIGRRKEVERISRLIGGGEFPLVTLTGPGGVGKTRLALQVVVELDSVFVDGVCFVELAAIREPEMVLPVII